MKRTKRSGRVFGGALFWQSGLAHAFENRLELGEICRVVAHRCPDGAEAGDREGRVEREAGLDCGTGVIEAAKLREGGAEHEIYKRKISV